MPKIEKQNTHLAIFNGKKIRRTIFQKEWWFSVADVCGALTNSPDAGAYWRKLKQRLTEEGSKVVTFCHGLKLEAPDGKMRETDCANTDLRQSASRFYSKKVLISSNRHHQDKNY